MEKDKIAEVLLADKEIFSAYWDKESGWSVICEGGDFFRYTDFEQDGMSALENLVEERDQKLCHHFVQEIREGLAGEVDCKPLTGNRRAVHLHLLNSMGDYVHYRIKCNFLKDEDEGIVRLVMQIRELDIEERYRIRLAQSITNDKNPSHFDDEVAVLFERHPEQNYVLIQFDVKKFKMINEQYGEDFGDELLEHFINTLKYVCNEEQLYVRLTADVFMILTAYETEEDIFHFIDYLDSKLLGYKNAEYTLAYGVSYVKDITKKLRVYGDGAALARQSIKNDALHHIAFYKSSMLDVVRDRKFMEDNMRQALEERQFAVYLQPKYSISSDHMVGAEALVRWIHPERGIIPPMDFIPLFEQNGFVVRIDQFVWEEACKVIRGWMDEGITPIPISVNVSRKHFSGTDFVDVLNGLVERYNIPKKYLEIEITETIDAANGEEEITRLKESGFTLLMDDFGSGYSSLNMLKDTQFDVIKIDRGFLQNFIGSPRGKKIVQHTIKMSQDIGLDMVAEGVETKEQAEFLSDCGCDTAQGFYYAKPMKIEEFQTLYRGSVKERGDQ